MWLYYFKLMKKFRNPFKDLTKFEWALWSTSILVVTLSFLLPEEKEYLNFIASLIGVTALIFVAKGYVIGLLLCIVFALIYGIISIHFKYYGEMITYVFMSMPMSIVSTIAWLKNPHKDTKEVKVGNPTKKQFAVMWALTVVVTFIFYFILKAFNTENLLVSTLSVATSFLAVYLTALRCPLYACAYALNDVVLIVLWVLASISNISYLPMVFCFIMFLANDLYGFINWKKMQKRQSEENALS